MLVKGEKIFLFDVWDEEAEEICESMESEGEKTVQNFGQTSSSGFLCSSFFISIGVVRTEVWVYG
jgi:hypothetical protein